MSVHLAPAIKNCHFGIEVVDSLKWEQWEPGGEYTKQITLKNVNMKTKKLKYRIPNTNFFTTRYPQPIVLSSGTSISFPITFRPLNKEKYEDAIEFLTKEGKFEVPMKATLPEAALNFPEMINFGMCAVKDQLTLSFKIYNISNLQVAFQLNSVAPFILNPTSGTLAPKTHCDVSAVFKPEGAFVHEVEAECLYSGTDTTERIVRKIKFEGIGKYVHLSVRYGQQVGHDININHGDVGVGQTIEKSFEIRNLSPVDAPFQIIQKSDVSMDSAFSCSVYHGIIQPESSMKVKLMFRPENVNQTYVDNFEVLAVGLASRTCIRCIGRGIGPEVSLDIGSVNFGIVTLNEEVTRSLKLKNNSSLDSVFHFNINPTNSVFKLNITSGVIEAKSTRTIILKFVPTKPIVFHRKVFCLVQNQSPITLELFGSSYTNQIKPVVLTRQHLERNKMYMKTGISRLPPEEIGRLVKEGKIVVNEKEILEIVDDELDANVEKFTENVSEFEGYMNKSVMSETCTTTPHVSLDIDTIDFGRCKEDTVIQKTVNVTNHTHGKLTCSWINRDKSVFTVSPDEHDIDPLSSASFRIIFRPIEPSKYYDSEMEAFVYYKSMRDHRLVDEKTITLPWCLTVNTIAHTFPTLKETFFPLATWESTNMVFPPVTSLTDSVYRTCVLVNSGDNPIHYYFHDDESGVFTCKPYTGVSRDKYQIIVFKMNAMEYGVNKRKVKCIMNDTKKFSEIFNLSMSAELPEVTLSPKDFVYFKPTCVGNVSEQFVTIKNTTRVPLSLQWKIVAVDEAILSVKENKKVILSNEIQYHKWTFSPSATMKHLFKVKLIVSTLDSNVELKPQKYVLRFIGEGQIGELKCDEQNLHFGEVNVGNSVTRAINIQNVSGCSLFYQLCVDQTVTSVDDGESMGVTEQGLKLDHYKFLLPSQAHKTLHVTMSPKIRANYHCSLYYKLIRKNDKEGDGEKHHLATIKVKGAYPQLQANDIRGAGCMEHCSKKYLWQLFHLENLNSLLVADPSPAELKYDISSRHSTRHRIPITTDAQNEFDFGTSVLDSHQAVIYLNIENTGSIATEWALRFPKDFQLEMEYWAETGDMDDEERHEMYVMNCELFSVQPKRGKIESGASQTIGFMYNHSSVGVHKLPVLFKIVQGREIRLNFIGNTIDSHECRLHLPALDHCFTPVCIATDTPPLQSYTLYNESGQTIKFSFDTSVLAIVQEDNYNHQILECLTPVGEIPPYQSLDTFWKFSPIEARSYSIGIPLHAGHNDSNMITFHGAGYNPKHMGATMVFREHSINSNMTTLVNFPSQQLLDVPNQLLKISREFLQFGDISLYSESIQLIFLTNVSKGRTISFRWILKGTTCENVVTVTPHSGFLKTGEHMMCKVKVFSSGPPAVHDFNVVCEIIDETLMAQFKWDLNEWRKKREEKKHLFTIKDIPEKKLTNNRPGSSTSKRLVAISSVQSRSDGDLKKYDTLPPIKSTKRSTLSPTERHIIVEERPSTQDDVKPLPPRTYKSHLRICVSTYSIKEYRRIAPQNTSETFIRRNPSVNRDKQNSFTTPPSHLEMDVMECTLTKLIKEVIDDKEFMGELKALKEEPVPYYAMLVPDLKCHEQTKSRSVMDGSLVELDERTSQEYIDDPGTNKDEVDQKKIRQENPVMLYNSFGFMRNEDDIDEYSEQDKELWALLQERQDLKYNDEVCYLIYDALESTLFNILTEANIGEISLTSRPRLIAPSSATQTDQHVPSL